jgi:hypothetical protein
VGLSQGLTQVLWNVDTNDWQNPPPEVIRQRVRDGVRPNSIIVILMHDAWTQNTNAALPGIIDDLRGAGYCLAFIEPDARLEPGVGKVRLSPAETPTDVSPSPTALRRRSRLADSVSPTASSRRPSPTPRRSPRRLPRRPLSPTAPVPEPDVVPLSS